MPADLKTLEIMGVLNITPDSFSDGGAFVEPAAALDQARRMVEEGARFIDIGGESSRPGADPVPADEERRRVLPVIEALAGNIGARISIDTWKASVARDALAAGADLVNDITGGRDPEMFGVAAEAGAGMVLMHTRGSPKDMMGRTAYDDIILDITAALREQLARARAAGITELFADPGIGFAKTAEQNYQVLKRLQEMVTSLDAPLLVGPSRKSFIGHLTGQPAHERIEGTIAACVIAALHGATILRVHDVVPVRRALLLAEAIRDA